MSCDPCDTDTVVVHVRAPDVRSKPNVPLKRLSFRNAPAGL